MSYQLGIDLGTTYTAAAINRGSERSPAGSDVVSLGTRSATVASVLYLADDGSILVGEAAERRALSDPDRVVREFKRRIGDEIPLMIGGRPHQAHELAARLVRWVVDQVSEREGGPPRRIAVTHPASWGAHKKDLLTGALRTVGLTSTFLAEPQAAAVSYASAERVEPGSTIAVYDLGGGTFDAAVVRKTGSGGFELLGQPEGIDNLGGVDFDEVVFGHVREGLGDTMDSLDPDDPDVLSAVSRLRRECVEAKEALSSDTEATIPVLLPELRTQCRLVRAEFETMIRPALEETVEALRRAVGSAGLTPDDLTAVLLVGGSSRIPLVSQLVSDELGRPVAVDADPKTAIALGAALAISPQPSAARQPPPGGPSARPGVPGAAAGAGLAGGGGVAGAATYVAGHAASAGAAAGVGSGGSGHGGPPRPPVRPEPRPAPAAFASQQPPSRPSVDHQRANFAAQHDPYAEPEKRRPSGVLVGVGGLIAIGAILAAVLLWPSSGANSDGAGNSTELPPSESAAPVAPVAPNNPARPAPAPRAPTRAPVPAPAPPPAPAPAPVSPRPTNPPPSNPPPSNPAPPPSNPPASPAPPPSNPPASGNASGTPSIGRTNGGGGTSVAPGTGTTGNPGTGTPGTGTPGTPGTDTSGTTGTGGNPASGTTGTAEQETVNQPANPSSQLAPATGQHRRGLNGSVDL